MNYVLIILILYVSLLYFLGKYGKYIFQNGGASESFEVIQNGVRSNSHSREGFEVDI